VLKLSKNNPLLIDFKPIFVNIFDPLEVQPKLYSMEDLKMLTMDTK
jgi:hypothetical protein